MRESGTTVQIHLFSWFTDGKPEVSTSKKVSLEEKIVMEYHKFHDTRSTRLPNFRALGITMLALEGIEEFTFTYFL